MHCDFFARLLFNAIFYDFSILNGCNSKQCKNTRNIAIFMKNIILSLECEVEKIKAKIINIALPFPVSFFPVAYLSQDEWRHKTLARTSSFSHVCISMCSICFAWWLVACLPGWLVGWLAGFLVGWFCSIQKIRKGKANFIKKDEKENISQIDFWPFFLFYMSENNIQHYFFHHFFPFLPWLCVIIFFFFFHISLLQLNIHSYIFVTFYDFSPLSLFQVSHHSPAQATEKI